MVRNNSSAEAKNSLLQLSNWGQVSNNDRDGIDTGADSAGSDESSHAAAQSIITQVSFRERSSRHSVILDIHRLFSCLSRHVSRLHQVTWPSSQVTHMVSSSQWDVGCVQVNSRSDKPAVASEYSKDDATEQSASWKDRLRAFFCCFAPDANEQYYRSSKAEATVIRPPQPPTPPAYRGEPVSGPLQVVFLSYTYSSYTP